MKLDALPPVLCLVLACGLATQATAATETATYRLRFDATWSAATHPVSFPSNPHFSRLTGGVHNGDVSFWQGGAIASPGIEAMAERGQTTPLDQEVMAAIAAGDALQYVEGDGIAVSPDDARAFFTASRAFSRVSVVTMVAPSPDWFVGVSGLQLYENGEWVEEKVVQVFAWDAGTDSGTNYTSPNSDTQPREPISLIDDGPLGNGVPLGTFTFTRTDSPGGDPLVLRNGRFQVTVEWQDFDLTRAPAKPQPLTDETGYFWFFSPTNVEMVIKVLDGCGVNDRFWVFAGGLTNVGVEIRVEDVQTSQVSVYTNDLGTPFEPILDTDAFATCP